MSLCVVLCRERLPVVEACFWCVMSDMPVWFRAAVPRPSLRSLVALSAHQRTSIFLFRYAPLCVYDIPLVVTLTLEIWKA